MAKYIKKDWREVANKQVTNTIASADEYEKNLIATVRAGVNPAHEAASDESLKRAEAALIAAFRAGRQKRQLLGVSDQEYIESISSSAFSTGVANTKKIHEFQTKFGPISEGITEEVRGMKNETLADRKARMDKNFELRSKVKYKDM